MSDPNTKSYQTLTVYKQIGGVASTNTVTLQRNRDGSVQLTDADGVQRFSYAEDADWIFELINSIST